jgi:hypothetical protein
MEEILFTRSRARGSKVEVHMNGFSGPACEDVLRNIILESDVENKQHHAAFYEHAKLNTELGCSDGGSYCG